MALSYDYAAKLIGVPQADAQPLDAQVLINSIRAQEASVTGMAYDAIATADGKTDLGSSVYTGINITLLSTWKLNFAPGAYQAVVSGGNLAGALTKVNNTGSPQVLMLASAASTLVGGSGDPNAIAAAVRTNLTPELNDITATADELLNIEGGQGHAALMREAMSVLSGNATGGPGTPQYKSRDGSKTRVGGVVDTAGNRTITTRDDTP
jgi:hypothetical protein